MANALEEIFLKEEKYFDSKNKEIFPKLIEEIKRLEYFHYDYMDEAENNVLKNISIIKHAPKDARFFVIYETIIISVNTNAAKVKYFK